MPVSGVRFSCYAQAAGGHCLTCLNPRDIARRFAVKIRNMPLKNGARLQLVVGIVLSLPLIIEPVSGTFSHALRGLKACEVRR